MPARPTDGGGTVAVPTGAGGSGRIAEGQAAKFVTARTGDVLTGANFGYHE